MLLIGSRAIKHYFPNFREPNGDWDFIATDQEINEFFATQHIIKDTSKNGKRSAIVSHKGARYKVEFISADKEPSAKLIYEHCKDYMKFNSEIGINCNIAPPGILFAIKKSHITFNIHWNKNIYDYLFLKKRLKVDDIKTWDKLDKIYRMRHKETKIRVGKKQFDFNVDNSEFFNRSGKFVNRVVPHDSLHYATCFGREPIFLSAKDDLNKAALSENKVNKLSHNMKIKMIQEEIMALSMERYIIPALLNNKEYDERLSYYKVAGQMVYNYLPDFLRLFAADNFLEILNLKFSYVDKCLNNHKELKLLLRNNSNIIRT